MRKKYGLKAILAGAMVSMALAAPAIVFSAPTATVLGEIHFSGAELRSVVLPGGETSVQAVFDVSIDRVINATGAAFYLEYDPDYLQPSDMDTNEALTALNSDTNCDDFFAPDPGLYYTEKDGVRTVINPFRMTTDEASQLDLGNHVIHMNLWLDSDSANDRGIITTTGGPSDTTLSDGTYIGGKIEQLDDVGYGGTQASNTAYVLNCRQDEDEADEMEGEPLFVTLGQLSFQVNMDHLPEMIYYFDGLRAERDHQLPVDAPGNRPWVTTKSLNGAEKETFLLDITSRLPQDKDSWSIQYFRFMGRGRKVLTSMTPKTSVQAGVTTMVDSYAFDFDGKQIVDVAATQPEVTVNAYQNFTHGDPGDLPLTMGRYSPTVTVTYADGSVENIPFPWGAAADGYAAEQETGTGSVPVSGDNYDPTHGVYTFSQRYRYTGADGTERTFPQPVTAKLTVTPITVVAVTAQDKERSYAIDDVLSQVPDVNALRLPEEARIQTDIVPGGVSLTVPIKGWRPVQPAGATATTSTWPGLDPSYEAGRRLNSLKADDFDEASGEPYWPDAADRAAITSNPERFLGRYSFETAQTDHQTKENILSADIQAKYPWLTIPFQPGSGTDRVEDWDVGQAYRSILSAEDFARIDPRQYEVTWASTVTETTGNSHYAPNDSHPNGVGQPTLTLTVSKRQAPSFSNYGSLSPSSVFRVWLPNGQELGTGQNAGGVAVENWFGDDPNPTDHVHGYYTAVNDRRLDASGDGLYFKLSTNPDQPEVNSRQTERETLRRYINLGGWYQVSVCEDPGAGDHWSQPIPVYVPPRRNEYTESKVYNFLGQNAGLYNWPGGVGTTLYLPRGEYAVVGPGGTTDTAGVGLPLYDVKDAGGMLLSTTDGLRNGAAVFEEGSIHRLLPNVTPHTESYGVKTIYDGQTGAQPGEVFTVKVKEDHTDGGRTTWALPNGYGDGLTHDYVGAASVYKYGPTPLYEGIDADGDGAVDGYAAAGFGRIFQPADAPDTRTVTLRRESPVKEAESVRIKLLSWETDGITRDPSDSTDFDNDNVALVTYDTKQEGYTSRQDFTLTIKNVGTTDIYGLDIDTVTDGYDLNDNGDGTRPLGGHFELLQAPAAFLPVGATTTFTLTYIYDLPASEPPNSLRYRDTLYITANGHDDPGVGHQHDTGAMDDQYLLDFDAEFAVSQDPLHTVTVIYRPENGNMGTANLIVGERGTSASDMHMIYTPTTRTYAKDGLVYVAVNKVDEYAVRAITAEIDGVTVDLLQNNRYGQVTLPGVLGVATIDDPMKEVYVFQMPDHDVTVYVDFYEPFHAKLRLEDLIDFSSSADPADGSPAVNDLKTAMGDPAPSAQHTYPVWRKQPFTEEELAAAQQWANLTTADQDYYLMTQGRAMPHGADWPTVTDGDDEGRRFVSSENQYLVVIDAEDDISQVEAKIRRVVYHEDYQGVDVDYPNGHNYEIELDVNMDLYPYHVEQSSDAGVPNWNSGGYTPTPVYVPASDPASGEAETGYGPSPAFTGSPRRAYSNATDYVVNGASSTDTYPPADGASDSSLHTSIQFPSPAKGQSSYVVITLSAYNPEIGRTDSRRYYLEIHRKTDEPDVTLHYGNSPYGMIMNEERFTTAAMQEAAKSAFLQGYTFEGQSRTVVPDAVRDHSDMHHVVYNREAWVRNRALFEPETLTGFHPARHSDGCQKFYDEDPNDHENRDNPLNIQTKPIYEPDKAVYVEEENLDLNDYAYFAILGENLREPGVVRAVDSSGREVPLSAITAVAMDVDWAQNGKGLTLLDASQTKQVARFRGDDTNFPVLDLGVQGSTLTFLAERQSELSPSQTPAAGAWPVTSRTVAATSDSGEPVAQREYTLVENIRPGRYAIVYSFTDFDGATTLQVDRPFVILRGVGDVNADGVRDNVQTGGSDSDEYHIEDRVGLDPLGYEAGEAVGASDPHGAVYPFANIFKFRVCDVNNDRNINHIDANQLDKNARADTGWLRFYHPVEYGLD